MTRKSEKAQQKAKYDWPTRRCKYCRVRFKPRPDQYGQTQQCCCADHRKMYHKHGGLHFDELVSRVAKSLGGTGSLIESIKDLDAYYKDLQATRAELDKLVRRIETLESRELERTLIKAG